MNHKRSAGIHLRLQESYTSLARQAINLGADSLQFFAIQYKAKRYFEPTPEDCAQFKELIHLFDSIYLHCSYWINLCSGSQHIRDISENLLEKELSFAQQLGISTVVLHPGAATRYPSTSKNNRYLGIKSLVRAIKKLSSWYPDITILLENGAQGGMTIGSNLNDFILLNDYLKNQPRVKWCFDTSHAFAYGYPISEVETFLTVLEATMSPSRIALIHCNDTIHPCGSRIDLHASPGKGKIGAELLKKLVTHGSLAGIPLLAELPTINDFDQKNVLTLLRSWR